MLVTTFQIYVRMMHASVDLLLVPSFPFDLIFFRSFVRRANSRHSLAFHAIEISVRMWEQLECALENAVCVCMWMCSVCCSVGQMNPHKPKHTLTLAHQWNIDDIHRKRAQCCSVAWRCFIFFLPCFRPDDDDDHDHECGVHKTVECEKYRWPFHRRTYSDCKRRG